MNISVTIPKIFAKRFAISCNGSWIFLEWFTRYSQKAFAICFSLLQNTANIPTFTINYRMVWTVLIVSSKQAIQDFSASSHVAVEILPHIMLLSVIFTQSFSHLLISFILFTFPTHPAEFSFCNFTGFLALFKVVTSTTTSMETPNLHRIIIVAFTCDKVFLHEIILPMFFFQCSFKWKELSRGI